MSIRIFITGGTFDKEYDLLTGNLFFKETHMEELLSKGRSQVPVEITTLMMKDSLDMTLHDRGYIAACCFDCDQDRIVITHGTDTMTETAKLLAGKTGLGEKTIVLTGAMIPIRFGSSDGCLIWAARWPFLNHCQRVFMWR